MPFTVNETLPHVLRSLGRSAEALDHAERAVAAREALIREDPIPKDYRFGLAESDLSRSLVRRVQGDPAAAAADARRALAISESLPTTPWRPSIRSAAAMTSG